MVVMEIMTDGQGMYVCFTHSQLPNKQLAGTDPFMELKTQFQFSKHVVMEGKRMSKPPKCSDSLFEVVTKCWQQDPADRPSFVEVVVLLKDVILVD